MRTEIEKAYQVAVEQVEYERIAIRHHKERLDSAVKLRASIFALLSSPAEKKGEEFHE